MHHGQLSECHYSYEVSLFYTRQPRQLNRAHKDKVAAHMHRMAMLGLKELQSSATTDCKYDLGMVDPSSKKLVIGRAKSSAEAQQAVTRAHGRASVIN